MGRAYEVRKASIQKTGAAKAKLYSMYAREIYQAAKSGGTELESNAVLKRLVEKARESQVPNDIIKRAIDKVNSGVDESYMTVSYELFGPSGSTIIVECLTDNVNRSVSNLRAVLNKTGVKMGAQGSVNYQYDNLCVVGFNGLNMEEVLDALILNEIDVNDIEEDENGLVVYGKPTDLYKIKETILGLKQVEFNLDEIGMFPKETITLAGEDLEVFNKFLTMIEEVEDVKTVYHNVEL